MNQDLIRARARNLQSVLQQLSLSSSLAASLELGLAPLIAQALAGGIIVPLRTAAIPANRVWTEGEMDDLPELSNAYGALCVALTDSGS